MPSDCKIENLPKNLLLNPKNGKAWYLMHVGQYEKI